MKKIMISVLALLLVCALEAKNVNIIMPDGTVKQAEFLGQDKTSVFIKNAEGKAETVKKTAISKIFDSDSGEEMNIGGASKEAPVKAVSAKDATKERIKKHIEQTQEMFKAAKEEAVGAGESAPVYKDSKAAPETKVSGDKYTVLDKGTIVKQNNLFTRSLPSYLMLDWELFYLDFSGGGADIKSAYNRPDYMEVALGTAFSLYVRPFDFAAIGGYVNIEYFFSADETDSYLDLPSSSFGGAYKWIIYSEEGGQGFGDGPTDNMFYIEARAGVRALGNGLDNAMLGGVPVTGSAPEYGLFVGFVAAEALEMKLGYRACVIPDVTTSKGVMNIDMSGFTLYYGICFH